MNTSTTFQHATSLLQVTSSLTYSLFLPPTHPSTIYFCLFILCYVIKSIVFLLFVNESINHWNIPALMGFLYNNYFLALEVFLMFVYWIFVRVARSFWGAEDIFGSGYIWEVGWWKIDAPGSLPRNSYPTAQGIQDSTSQYMDEPCGARNWVGSATWKALTPVVVFCSILSIF